MKAYLTSTALTLVLALGSSTALAAGQHNFSELDANQDGQIDTTEFERESRAMFDRWDANRDERITESELYAALFNEFDDDNDGRLSQEQYTMHAHAWLGPRQQPEFENVDRDGDGTVTEEEFTSAMQNSDAFAAWNAEGQGVDWTRFHVALFDVYSADDDDMLNEQEFARAADQTRTQEAAAAEAQQTEGQTHEQMDGQQASAEQPRADDQDPDTTAAVGSDNVIPAEEVISLSDWQADGLYANGFSIDYLLDEVEVHGPTGDEIGSIENVVFSTEGELLSIVAEVGGFWDMFDTHVSVPWDQVTWDSTGRLTIPVTEENVEDYDALKTDYLLASVAGEEIEVVDDDLAIGQRAFRATDLIGDYARIRDGDGYRNYGYVNDLIVSDGKLQSIVVTPGSGYGISGPYAYPYYARGWYAGRPYYDMPYDRTEVVEADRIEYEQFGYN